MVGVSWGMPTEFRWKDKIIPAADVPDAWMPSWNPSAPAHVRYTEAERVRIRKDGSQ